MKLPPEPLSAKAYFITGLAFPVLAMLLFGVAPPPRGEEYQFSSSLFLGLSLGATNFLFLWLGVKFKRLYQYFSGLLGLLISEFVVNSYSGYPFFHLLFATLIAIVLLVLAYRYFFKKLKSQNPA